MVVFFVAVYVPVIRSEEAFLCAHFPDYEQYARPVPALFPRSILSPIRAGFSRKLYFEASRVQFLGRRRYAGGACCENVLVQGMTVHSLRRYFLAIALLFAVTSALLSTGAAEESNSERKRRQQPRSAAHTSSRCGPGFSFPRQTLRYEAEYRYWTAGVATLKVERADGLEHVISVADSTGVVAMLFSVQDRFDSYLTRTSLCSQRVTKHTEEGSHRRDTQIVFDYKRGKSVLDGTNLQTNQKKRQENDIPSCVTDVVSGILYVASLPLQQGATYSFPLNDGGKTVTVQAHVEGKEQIKTSAGTFQTVRVGPEGDYGPLEEPWPHLDLVHRRCAAHSRADAGQVVLGDPDGLLTSVSK